MNELERLKAIHDILKVQSKAHAQSNRDWQKSYASVQTKLEAALKEMATLSAATEAKDRELVSLREGNTMMSSRMRRTILARTDTRKRTILCILTVVTWMLMSAMYRCSRWNKYDLNCSCKSYLIIKLPK